MGKLYNNYLLLLVGGLFFTLFLASCGKDHNTPAPAKTGPLTLGLYEYQGSLNRRVFIPITKVGTVTTAYLSVFDTGSSGMTIDATGILPASMITSAGIQVTGDSVTVNGITVTAQTAIISYGDATNKTQEYGNLAYAPVTIGDANGNVTTKRIPFFMYYKAIDVIHGTTLKAHSNDVFGVGPGFSFPNTPITSPLSSLTLDGTLTSGFKLAMLDKNSFSSTGTYVGGLLTLGLTTSDLLPASGFIMHPLTYTSSEGYSSNIPATVTFNGKTIAATLLFDTGTPSISNIEDNGALSNVTTLPANSVVQINTGSGFSYQYTVTSTYNLTQVERPSYTHDPRTIFSIDFFIDNEFLMDYTNHQIGLKNN